MRYEAMARWLRERMDARHVASGRELIAMMDAKKCSVHENMVSRWLTGKGRPQDHRLEALLDVLGVVLEEDREAVRKLAYFPPNVIPNRAPDEDDADVVVHE